MALKCRKLFARTELEYLNLVPSHINLVGAEIEMVDRNPAGEDPHESGRRS